jgi:hypothetical protein
MAYIGQPPFQEFTSIPTKDNFTGDGSTTAFDLAGEVPLGAENALEVFVANVRQEPGTGKAFTLGQDGSGDFKRITFASAPSNGAAIYAMYTGVDGRSFTALTQLPQDLDGAELILDGDGDTSITADTDDRIDIKIGGADDFQFTANAFNVLTGSHATFADSANAKFGTGSDMLLYHDGTNSYITNAVGALKIATETSGIAVTIGHSTSEVTIADNATVAGNLTVTGTLTQTGTQTFDGGIDVDDFNINGTTIALSSGDMTVDVAGDIILDADGGDIFFKDAGTTFGSATNTSGNLIIKSGTTTAATFSGANVTLAGTVGSGAITSTGAISGASLTADDVAIDGKVITMTGSSGDTFVTTVAANGATSLVTTDAAAAAAHLQITADGTVDIDSAGVLTLDSGAAINIEPASGSAILLDGTISIDAGVVTGATSITSTAFVGDITGDVTGNASGTALTVTQAAQTAITSLGTLTALTVDDVAVDGKAITMTGSSGDTFTTTVGTNGATTLTTVDAAAAAANITITADGTAELAGTTVTLNSSGGITLDADGGTITFADAGSSLGTITSSGYSGTAAVATTVTITDNESTNENNAVIFTAGGDVDGGNIGLESDGDLTYNPSTGTLNVPNISVTGTQTIVNSVTMNASNAVIFEGATADAYETTLSTVDATADRTINLPNQSGTLPVLAAASATQITSTPAELNLIDGGTARGTTAVASGDGILINDGGTMRMTNVDTVSTYFSSHNVGGGNIVTTGALNAGSITSGFGTINNGSSTITTTGAVATGAITAGGNIIIPNAGNIGSAGDTDALAIASNGVVTFSQIPVMPANSIDSDEYIDGSIDREHLAADIVDGTKIADNAINSEHYTDGSIDTAHIADLNVTGGKLALDRRSAASTNDVYHGNTHDYIFSDADVGLRFYTANAEDMRLTDAGALHVDGDITAFSTTISDERLKENIQPIEDALSKVGQLNGVTFTYKADGKESAGLIAQDVEKVLPSAVRESELPLQMNDGKDYKVLQYDQTIGLLVESIKELTAKVEKLEKK